MWNIEIFWLKSDVIILRIWCSIQNWMKMAFSQKFQLKCERAKIAYISIQCWHINQCCNFKLDLRIKDMQFDEIYEGWRKDYEYSFSWKWFRFRKKLTKITQKTPSPANNKKTCINNYQFSRIERFIQSITKIINCSAQKKKKKNKLFL